MLDPSTAHGSLKVSRDCKSVSYETPSSGSDSRFPFVMSVQELGLGQHYWEVKVWDKNTGKRKSWCVGVIQKAVTENYLQALCYESGVGLYPNTDRSKIISTQCNITTLGLRFNSKKRTLCFLSVDETFRNLHTFSNLRYGTYFAFFSPGVKDKYPVRILD